MSRGAIGKGTSYWATIKISGDLKAEQLQKIKQDIEKILKGNVGSKPVKGSIEREARANDADGYKFDSKGGG